MRGPYLKSVKPAQTGSRCKGSNPINALKEEQSRGYTVATENRVRLHFVGETQI